jgi:type III restriction enzyme
MDCHNTEARKTPERNLMADPRLSRVELADEGSHYFRADFQVHTPRDPAWSGKRPKSDDERKAWARDFVAAARKNQLNAVAISDHHDFALFPYVQAAALSETDAAGNPLHSRDRLVVFPALELTLSVPCQAILILDADFPVEKLDDVLKALNHEPVDPALAQLPQTQFLPDSKDLESLVEKLDNHAFLRGRYILLPNVTPNGHKTLLRDAFQAKYQQMPCVGGYLDGSIEKLESKPGKLAILDGRDKNWGSKRLAVFQTSDSRSDDFSHLGEFATWVKWSEPTAEALRQACLAPESRIAQATPPIPNVWLSRVVVTQSKFMGRIDLALNPQYTALIGGRGTGKSTILDYVRWALCDQPAEAGEDDEVANPRVRQRRLIESTLRPLGGQVEVHCSINGVPHVVRRNSESGDVELKVGDEPFEKSREGVVRSLLPIQAYSQKQLSSVALRLEELTRFVTAPVQRELEAIQRELDDVTGRLRENYGTLQRARVLDAEISRTAARRKSLTDQSVALRQGLSGLSDDERDVLEQKAGYDMARSVVQDWSHELSAAEQSTRDLAGELDATLQRIALPEDVPDSLRSQLLALHEDAHAAVQRTRETIGSAATAFASERGEGSKIGADIASIETELAEYAVRYSAVKQQSTAHETKLGELAELERQATAANELLQGQGRELARLGEPKLKHAALRAELDELNRRRSAVLAGQCDLLSKASDGLMRATLAVGQNFEQALARLKGLVVGSNVRTAKFDALFERLSVDKDPVASWELALQEFEELMLMEPDAEVSTEQTKTLSRLGLSPDDQKRIRPKLTPDGWLDLSLTPLTDKPQFEYQSAENTYIPFKAASAGQQATALLSTLLSQDGMPLIVDQPEEDLDSDTIQAIVRKVWEAKGRRQILFASHNANLVVNGDADLVLVCAYSRAGDQSAGQIKAQGAIDQRAVREEITRVMEGGESAFKLRKEKYGF